MLYGTHYTRSLKGLMLLCECFERLQWAEFLTIKGVREYMKELSLIQLMKSSVAEKNREESRAHLEAFMSTSSGLIDDFNAFRSERCEVLETFAFWDRFVKMVSILRDLVRADHEEPGICTSRVSRQFFLCLLGVTGSTTWEWDLSIWRILLS